MNATGELNSSMSKIEMVLEVLSDGEWHSIMEIQQLTELNEQQTKEIAAFLFEYEFAKVDVESNKVRISKCFRELLTQVATC
ncbi:MAG: hypothetical protein NWF04_06345 [Candidatus Bathyarchaeota archaeon]|nr:hypothetical protein [Candidatus Bathyarchaeota archaeon]